MPTSRIHQPRSRPEFIGTLDHDPTSLARIIYERCVFATQQVWVDDALVVHAHEAESSTEAPAHWIVGTYAVGCGPNSIADDLRALLRERSKDWIVE